MEATLKERFNKNTIKNFISSLINKQLGEKLNKLEQNNKIEITEIKIISNISKELINNLSNLSNESNKYNKIKRTFNLKNNLSGSLNRNTQFKKNIFTKNNNFMRKSFTPLRVKSSISNNKFKYNRISRISRLSVKSLDLLTTNKSSKMVTNFNKKNLRIKNNNFNSKKSNKEIYKTPIRKKNKNNFNIHYKTEEKLLEKNNNLNNYINALKDNNDIDRISINFEEERISNLKINSFNNNNKNYINNNNNYEMKDIDLDRLSLELAFLYKVLYIFYYIILFI